MILLLLWPKLPDSFHRNIWNKIMSELNVLLLVAFFLHSSLTKSTRHCKMKDSVPFTSC